MRYAGLLGRKDGDDDSWKWERIVALRRRARRFLGRRVLAAPIFLVAVAALAFLALSPSNNPPVAHATDGLTIVKSCSPEAAVPGLVQYVFEISNNSGEGLDRVSVDDTGLGPITTDFPSHP